MVNDEGEKQHARSRIYGGNERHHDEGTRRDRGCLPYPLGKLLTVSEEMTS